MKRLAIIGTKEFAEQITDFALQTGNFEVVGYYDNIETKGNIVNGRSVLGAVEDAIEGYKNNVFDEIFIGVGYTRFDLREQFYTQLKGKVPFANILMPSAKIVSNVSIGEGVFIGGGSFIGEGSKIGDNVFIHGNTNIGHNNTIGNHTYISGRFNSAGFCEIGRRNFIGICVIIADHISICDDVWIGLGCIVAKNIKEPGKYMSPAAKLYKIE